MSASTRRRRRYLKYAAYTAGAIGAGLLAKKLFGGSVKKGTNGGDVLEENIPPEDSGFSDASEQGLMTSSLGFGGGGNTMLYVLVGAAVLLILWKK